MLPGFPSVVVTSPQLHQNLFTAQTSANIKNNNSDKIVNLIAVTHFSVALYRQNPNDHQFLGG